MLLTFVSTVTINSFEIPKSSAVTVIVDSPLSTAVKVLPSTVTTDVSLEDIEL